MSSRKFTFTGHDGSRLAGRLELPPGRPRAAAIFAHCFTCSKDVAAARRVSGRLAALGFAVLRFDFTGLGHSGGEFANTGFRSNVEDILRAAAALAEEVAPPALLVGHSFGGAAVLRAAGEIESVRAVATIAAPADPAHVLETLGISPEEIAQNGEVEVAIAGRSFRLGRGFVGDVSAEELKAAIGRMRRALLVMHAPGDRIVGIENATEIFLAARHPKSFVSLDDADHLLSRPKDAEYAATVIAAWASRYVEAAPEPQVEGAPEGVVRASEADPEGFLQNISAGPRHHILADEPESHGGTDLGMTPFNLLAAALAACTSMTIRMYARRKGWPLEHVEVDVSHDKIHAEECAHCETRDGKVDRFRRVIRLEGPLDEEQRARLLEIADRCPVHRTLTSEVVIETRLA